MSATMNLEQELREVTEEIGRLDAEASEQHEAAERLVQEYKEKGVSPLKDKEAFEAVDAAYMQSDGLKQEAAELRHRRDTLMERLGQRSSRRRERESVEAGDMVEQIMASPEYQRLRETGSFAGQGGRIEIPAIEVVSRGQAVAHMQSGLPILATTANVDAMIDLDQRRFPPVPIPVRTIRVLDMITVQTTDSDQVAYVEETERTDAAAETAAGTSYSEATYSYTERTASVRDIGHFTPAHRSNLADAGQVRALLEGRLSNGVERRLESQIVNGNGTGQNLEGILNKTGIGSIDRDATNNEPRLEALHRGITAVRVSLEADPDAIGIHPSDYEDVVFEKGSDGQFLLGPASQQTSRTIWGLPAVVSTVFPANTALVGNYREGAVLWMRSGVAVRASDSHSDFFTKRMVALLAELRAAFAAWQARAWAEVLLA